MNFFSLSRFIHQAASVGCLLLAAAGCSKKITIIQYPDYYRPEMRGMAIVVVPFKNPTRDRSAGTVVADKLAAMLNANGTYKVYNTSYLKSIMDERKLQAALSDDPSQMAKKFRQLKGVNAKALLIGTILQYTATQRNEPRREPIYQYNPRTKTNYIAGYRSFVHTRNEANVSVTATLVRLRDGAVIHTTGSPASYRMWAQGSPPKLDPYACLSAATDNVVARLVVEFAVIRRQIKIDPAKTVRTASELYDNKWTWKKHFKKTDKTMYAVIMLPRCCDRNRFRIVVVRKNQRRPLAEVKFVWSKDDSGRGFRLDPSDIAAKGGGSGTYTIKFYSGPEPVVLCDFHID